MTDIFYILKDNCADRNRPWGVLLNIAWREMIDIAHWAGENNIKTPRIDMEYLKYTYDSFNYKGKLTVKLKFDSDEDAMHFKLVWE